MADQKQQLPAPRRPPPRRPAGPLVAKLLARGAWGRARQRLQAELQAHPDDDGRRRQLIQCLAQERRYVLLAAALSELRAPAASELQQAGLVFLRGREWAKATAFLQQSLNLTTSASTYYLLAQARARGLPDGRLAATARAAMIELLAQAAAGAACPEEALLWLGQLRGLEWYATHPGEERRGAARAQAAVYAAALDRNPAYAQVRRRLLHTLMDEIQDWDHAWQTLAPLLDQEPRLPEVNWWAFQIQAGRNDLAAARTYLDQVPLCAYGLGHDKVWGDLFLERGRIAEAIACYSREVARDDPDAHFFGLFSRATAYLATGDLSATVADAAAVVTEWFASAAVCPPAPPFLWPVGQNLIFYPVGGECIPTVCRALAEKERPEVTPELRGRLLYMGGVYRQQADVEKKTPTEQREIRELFLRAAALTSHPKLGWDVARCYVLQDQVASAVQPALAYARWQYEQHAPNGPSWPPFYEDPWLDSARFAATERTAIHRQALDYRILRRKPTVSNRGMKPT